MVVKPVAVVVTALVVVDLLQFVVRFHLIGKTLFYLFFLRLYSSLPFYSLAYFLLCLVLKLQHEQKHVDADQGYRLKHHEIFVVLRMNPPPVVKPRYWTEQLSATSRLLLIVPVPL